MATVVITDYEYPDIDSERAIVTAAGHDLRDYQAASEEELIEITRDADAVIVQYAALSRRVIEAMTRCRMIIKYGIGVNNIDVEAATACGIHVCNVPDYGLDEVSNHAIAMLLGLARKLFQADRAVRDGGWGIAGFRPLFRMAGKTLGIVGFGALGRLVARKMAGFGLTIIAHDPYLEQTNPSGLDTVPLVSFDDLCRRSDYITLHCPLTKDTAGMFDRDAFTKMKRTALLVNTSRGGVINEADLADALSAGLLAGAGLDVFAQEPVSRDHPLLGLPNVMVSGHAAWYSEESIAALQRKTAEEVVNVLAGNPPFHPCNAPRSGGAGR